MKFIVEWETCFNDDLPERMGEIEVEANSKEEARKKVKLPYHSIVLQVLEEK